MKTIELLRQRAPGLAHRIESADEPELRRLASAVARAAVERTGLSDPLIDKVMQRTAPDAVLRARVLIVAEKLDDRYFTLKEPLEERQDAGKTDPHVMVAFSRARAASAVAESLGDDAREAAASAAYEAFIATGDADYLTDAVERALAI